MVAVWVDGSDLQRYQHVTTLISRRDNMTSLVRAFRMGAPLPTLEAQRGIEPYDSVHSAACRVSSAYLEHARQDLRGTILESMCAVTLSGIGGGGKKARGRPRQV
jgi:hypothetical protein